MTETQIIDSEFKEELQKIRESRILEIERNTDAEAEASNPVKGVRKEFDRVFIDSKVIGDIPLPLIYEYLYNPNRVCDEYDKGKNFINSILLNRDDYDITFENKCPNADKIPEIFTNFSSIKNLLLSKEPKESMKKLLESSKEWALTTRYDYFYVHPLVKVFMGPDKVNVNENYRIYFISPDCLIVEIYSFCSGFMLMDTFFNVIQYKYESDFDLSTGSIQYKNTRVTISYAMEFVKANIFKARVISEGLKDNEKALKEYFYPNIESTLLSVWKKLKIDIYGSEQPVIQNQKLIKNEITVTQANFQIISNQNPGFKLKSLLEIKGIIIILLFVLLSLFFEKNFSEILSMMTLFGLCILIKKVEMLTKN